MSGNKKAKAEYEIAELPDGHFALRMSYGYTTGNMSSVRSPWTAFATRKECVEHFAQRARQHFSRELAVSNVAESQQVARKQMLALLQDGLFGFVEPPIRDTV